jgi:hypothetical protein
VNIRIRVDVFNGPLPGGGFKSGMWPFSLIIEDGLAAEVRTGSVFATVPYQCDLDEQRRRVELALARSIVGFYANPTRHARQVEWDEPKAK